MPTEEKNYRILSHRDIFHGRVFDVFVDDIEYDTGVNGIREVARHPGGAVIIAMFPDETILLVRQFRFAIDKWLWELPAGKLDPGEDPLQAAWREFEEETGYTAGSMQILTRIYSTPGFCTEMLYLYVATGLVPKPEGQNLEEGERTLTVHRLPIADVISMIERGEITDAKTICGIFLAHHMLHTR